MTYPAEIVNRLMQEADTLLQGLFSNALIGVYVIQDERFVYVNQRLADLFAYTQEALCSGMGPMDLVAAGDQALARREIDRRVKGEAEASFYGFRGVRQDGGQIDVEVFGVATAFGGRAAIIGMLLDVSERCQAEREIGRASCRERV